MLKKSVKKTTPKVVSTKPLPGAGAYPEVSAKIGGIGNKVFPVNYKKGK